LLRRPLERAFSDGGGVAAGGVINIVQMRPVGMQDEGLVEKSASSAREGSGEKNRHHIRHKKRIIMIIMMMIIMHTEVIN
jgi:hypothetical protein